MREVQKVEPEVPSLVMTEVSKSFGSLQVVKDFSLTLRPGEGVTLWGSNGTGKTTLLRLAMGLLQPDAGLVRLNGVDPRQDPVAARRNVGYVPQKVSFPPYLTVAEIWRFYGECRRVPPADLDAWARHMRIEEWMNRRVEHLSGGMAQRVALAIATLGTPRLLVLDEPGANLDSASLDRFLEVVQALKARGTSVLLATHDAREMRALSDRVVERREGLWAEVERAHVGRGPWEMTPVAAGAVSRR